LSKVKEPKFRLDVGVETALFIQGVEALGGREPA